MLFESLPRTRGSGPIVVIILASVAAGCASPTRGPAPTVQPVAALATPANAANADSKVNVDTKVSADSNVTCHTEVPAGSRVGVRVCETAAQREAREAAVRATRDQLSRPTPGCAQIGPGGCPGGG